MILLARPVLLHASGQERPLTSLPGCFFLEDPGYEKVRHWFGCDCSVRRQRNVCQQGSGNSSVLTSSPSLLRATRHRRLWWLRRVWWLWWCALRCVPSGGDSLRCRLCRGLAAISRYRRPTTRFRPEHRLLSALVRRFRAALQKALAGAVKK